MKADNSWEVRGGESVLAYGGGGGSTFQMHKRTQRGRPVAPSHMLQGDLM